MQKKIIEHIFFGLLFLMPTMVAFAQTPSYSTGCILDKEAYEKVEITASLMRGDFAGVPKKYSLRKYAPVPQNQGSYGTCVGWATAYSARTIMMAQQNNWDKEKDNAKEALVNENALSPFFVYEHAKSITDIYCQEGTSLFNALEIIKEIGTVKFNEFASQCGQAINKLADEKAQKFKIKDYKRLFESSSMDKVKLVKKSISENKPVIIGIQCCIESFLNAKGKKIWKPQKTDNLNPDGGHALTVIGYDDGLEGGAVELMNSWGTVWGDQGFIWMSYEDFARYCFEGYEMIAENTEVTTLSGSLQFVLSAGEKMEAIFKDQFYEVKKAYNSGTLFRLQISNNEPAYVYAFASDLSGRTFKVFPHQTNMSAYLSYKANNIAIPDEDHYIQMDNTVGTDYFCVLYSAEKLEIENIMTQIESMKEGAFYEKVYRVLGQKLIPSQDIYYSTDGKISFKGISKNKTIVPIIVAIPHI